MRKIILKVVIGIGMFVMLVTLLPFINTDEWWVRGWDFPRPQILIVALVAFISLCFLIEWRNRWHLLMGGCLLAAIVLHAYRIIPYTILWAQEIEQISDSKASRCFSILTANVLMKNRNVEAVRREIMAVDPDIVLLMENNLWWSEALSTVKAEYPHVTDHPRENTYGMLFMTRLQVADAAVRFLVSDDVPSIKARLVLPSGQPFTFYGLHPEPPQIGQNTDQRDAELIIAAKELRDSESAAIVAGDLNDVAWSHTTRLFQRTSQTLDPRRGRGLFASFHADHWYARWPLDHIFVTPHFLLKELTLLPYIGSDHFPVVSHLCLDMDARSKNSRPEHMQGNDAEDIQESINKAKTG